jgi:hypothetical protein
MCPNAYGSSKIDYCFEMYYIFEQVFIASDPKLALTWKSKLKLKMIRPKNSNPEIRAKSYVLSKSKLKLIIIRPKTVINPLMWNNDGNQIPAAAFPIYKARL